MNREQWLNSAKNLLISEFLIPEKVVISEVKTALSIGYPKGQRKVKALAQCLDPALSEDGITEIFVSPESNDSEHILASLTVALVRANHGYYTGTPAALTAAMERAFFMRSLAASKVDYEPTEDARELLADLARELGPIPHAKVSGNRKKQSTRLLKVECTAPGCGAVWRMSAKWAHQCIVCPCCGDLNTPPTIHV